MSISPLSFHIELVSLFPICTSARKSINLRSDSLLLRIFGKTDLPRIFFLFFSNSVCSIHRDHNQLLIHNHKDLLLVVVLLELLVMLEFYACGPFLYTEIFFLK